MTAAEYTETDSQRNDGMQSAVKAMENRVRQKAACDAALIQYDCTTLFAGKEDDIV